MAQVKKNAVALKGFTAGDDQHVKGAVIEGLPLNQFNDWKDVHLVREATNEDVAAAKKAAQV